MRSPRSSLDLMATMGLALLGLVAALASPGPWIEVPLLLAFVLVLPGYAVAAILLPPGSIPPAERSVYVVAMSVSVTVLGGVLVQLVIGLDRTVWALVLAIVTLAAGTLALRRRARLAAAEAPGPRGRPPVPRLAPVLAIAVAVGIAAWATAIASEGAREDRAEARFTQLWALPAGESQPGGPGVAAIGVENHEGAPTSYRIEVSQGGEQIATRAIRLGEGELWRTRVAVERIAPDDPLRVTLLRDGEVYRHVLLGSDRPL